MLEDEEDVINDCLDSVDKTDTYLLTTKSFKIKKDIEKKDVEKKIIKYINSKK